MERTLWDGDQVLMEIRAPSDPGGSGDWNPESDTGGGGDQRFYGRVAYVHAGGIDQPLELVRMDVWQPFSAVPHANWRGTYDVLTMTGSRYAECGPQIGYGLGTQPECFPFDLASINAWGDLKPKNADNSDPGPRSWAGSLITGSRDASGLLYRRNRYLDPKSGRFTQEDPIGLAGGLNSYGFAGGDPITYSDPYGLCVPWPQCALAAGAATSRGGTFLGGVIGTVVEPGGGTLVGAGIGNRVGWVLGAGGATVGAIWLAVRGPEDRSASQEVPDLGGKTQEEAEGALGEAGFVQGGVTSGGKGYTRYDHPDGSQVQVRPNGEVVRLGPRMPGGQNSPGYRRRYGPDGEQIPFNPGGGNTHGTGEVIRGWNQ